MLLLKNREKRSLGREALPQELIKIRSTKRQLLDFADETEHAHHIRRPSDAPVRIDMERNRAARFFVDVPEPEAGQRTDRGQRVPRILDRLVRLGNRLDQHLRTRVTSHDVASPTYDAPRHVVRVGFDDRATPVELHMEVQFDRLHVVRTLMMGVDKTLQIAQIAGIPGTMRGVSQVGAEIVRVQYGLSRLQTLRTEFVEQRAIR